MRIVKNPTREELETMINRSRHKAARRIIDDDGTVYCWPAEDGTHAEGAKQIGIRYTKPPGAGDILTVDGS